MCFHTLFAYLFDARQIIIYNMFNLFDTRQIKEAWLWIIK